MLPKLDKKARLVLVKKALKGKSITLLASKAGISRVLLYRWIKEYKKRGAYGLIPKHSGRPSNPQLHKKKIYPRLSVNSKTLMLNEVLVQGGRPAEVAKKYGISRVTFYKWLGRYKKALSEDDKKLALLAKTPKIDRYFRQTPEKYEEAILSLVASHPEYGIRSLRANLPKIGDLPIVGHHGVQNVLRRNDLLTYAKRLEYAKSLNTGLVVAIDRLLRPVLSFFNLNYDLRSATVKYGGIVLLSAFLTIVVVGIGSIFTQTIIFSDTGSKIGLLFAFLALGMGSVFFLYSLKYYLTLAVVLSYSQSGEESKNSLRNGLLSGILGLKTDAGRVVRQFKHAGLEPDLSHISLVKKPYISVQIPFYNEKNVAERAIRAATSFKYPGEYEVILCDDSTDETTAIIRRYMEDCLFKNEKMEETKGDGWVMTRIEVKPGVTLKHIHRTTREGYKGKALELALKLSDKRTEFVAIFDADFVPYPDSLDLFLRYFKAGNNMNEDYKGSNLAAVQGYQWHVLNKSENWITRGIRGEYAGSYVIERSGAEIYGGLKQISGSVYMIRQDVLAEIGWGSSITEDFELTLRLYNAGYKVLYTPYIQAPAECVSTVKRLIRQRMRWAEGHSFNVKKMFKSMMWNPKVSLQEKLEFGYLTPYYLQAAFFLVGSLSWIISETIFKVRLPFWTELWGWSLVLTNMFALPLVNSVGLFVEESEERDYLGIISFMALSYLLVPFQAYASVKGLVEKEEGPWFRTPKTGRITDIFSRGKFYRFIQGFLPGSVQKSASIDTKYLALSSANSRFNSFSLSRAKARWIGKAVLSILLIFSISLLSLTRGVTSVYATDMTGPLKLGLGTDGAGGTWPTWGNFMQNTSSYGTGATFFRMQSSFAASGTNNWAWYTRLLPTGTADGSLPSGTYYLQVAKSNGRAITDTYNVGVQLLLTNNNGVARTQILGSKFQISPTNANNTLFQYSIGTLGSAQPITAANPNRISLRLFWINGTNASGWLNLVINNSSVPARLVTPGNIQVPEIPKVFMFIVVIVVIPVIPEIVSGKHAKRGKKRNLFTEFKESWEDILRNLLGSNDEKFLDELPV